MNRQTIMKNYFSFSRKERIAAILLIIMITLFALLPFFNRSVQNTTTSPTDTAWMQDANKLLAKENTDGEYNKGNYANDPNAYQIDNGAEGNVSLAKGTLFKFDPNTLDADGFKRLGLRDRTIQILINYRNKGGRFKTPDDMKKIYGLRPEEFERLRSYISISGGEGQNQYANGYKTEPYASNTQLNEPKPKYHTKTIEINAADIAAYESLYGIGNKLASRIINFRDKLGGFYAIEQVGETYGVPDSTFQKIKHQLQVNPASIKKININTANYEVLNNHPYISSKLAYLLLKQKKEKGNYTSIDELKPLVEQTSDSYEKISKYLTIE